MHTVLISDGLLVAPRAQQELLEGVVQRFKACEQLLLGKAALRSGSVNLLHGRRGVVGALFLLRGLEECHWCRT
ncbi:hypothetical protein P367_11500 [Comamonas thiooxydans]|nr:hypothetical protein P609_08040 [Comamonas thiooxydans]KGG92470.1 hypothetical protein P369_09880 [Comamonas thiooxydans]KGG98791.1 hypothetical protein P367_11500 [Comamonas thiooxydans]